jgi:hypothetical protein
MTPSPIQVKDPGSMFFATWIDQFGYRKGFGEGLTTIENAMAKWPQADLFLEIRQTANGWDIKEHPND